MNNKEETRARRKRRIRRRIEGSAERPRLTVFRSAKHTYAQVVDDLHGKTLAQVSTLTKDLRDSDAKKTDAAKAVGQALAKACLERGIKKVVFDRNGFLYHGRVKAVAEGAREGGLEL